MNDDHLLVAKFNTCCSRPPPLLSGGAQVPQCLSKFPKKPTLMLRQSPANIRIIKILRIPIQKTTAFWLCVFQVLQNRCQDNRVWSRDFELNLYTQRRTQNRCVERNDLGTIKQAYDRILNPCSLNLRVLHENCRQIGKISGQRLMLSGSCQIIEVGVEISAQLVSCLLFAADGDMWFRKGECWNHEFQFLLACKCEDRLTRLKLFLLKRNLQNKVRFDVCRHQCGFSSIAASLSDLLSSASHWEDASPCSPANPVAPRSGRATSCSHASTRYSNASGPISESSCCNLWL